MVKSNKVTNLNIVKNKTKENSKVSALSPREIVSELDRYVIGQKEAKKAVAVALRNRWRRQALKGEMRDEVLPKNILMIGPTGVGKTEISRRLSKLAQAPFVKVEATRFTEVGYVGRDVEQIVRDLLEIAIALEKVKKSAGESPLLGAATMANSCGLVGLGHVQVRVHIVHRVLLGRERDARLVPAEHLVDHRVGLGLRHPARGRAGDEGGVGPGARGRHKVRGVRHSVSLFVFHLAQHVRHIGCAQPRGIIFDVPCLRREQVVQPRGRRAPPELCAGWRFLRHEPGLTRALPPCQVVVYSCTGRARTKMS